MDTSTQPTAEDAATQVTLLVDELVAAMVNARIYAASHPRVVGSISAVQHLLREVVLTTGEDPVRVACAESLLVFRRRPLLGASLSAMRLIEVLERWQAGGIELGSGATQSELEALFAALADRSRQGVGVAALNKMLAAQGCTNVRVLPPYVDTVAPRGPSAGSGNTVRLGVRIYQSVMGLLQNVTVSVCCGGKIDFAPVQSEAEAMLKRLESPGEPLLGLARQDQYDAFTFGHSVRVAVLALNFARTLTDDRDLLIRIGVAALLHDVGKSLVPFEILHSHKPLTRDEQQEMSRHAEFGARILLDHQGVDPLAVATAFGHHRAENGEGYPHTAHEHRTAMVTNVLRICDIYEALTAARPYKNPMSPVRAYRVMIAMGDKLDQRLLKRFIAVNGVYPVGQMVSLTTGEVGVVQRQTDALLRPVVHVLEDAAGNVLEEEQREVVDLSDLGCCASRAIFGELVGTDARERREAAVLRV